VVPPPALTAAPAERDLDMDALPRPIALVSRSVLVVAVSIISGLLIAGLLLPVVGGVGLVARAGSGVLESPAELDETPLAQRTRILAADGSVLAEVTDGEDRIVTTLKNIPAGVQHALLAIEDDGFYDHAGLDVKGVVRALWKNHQAGEVKQGASTLTQQYVKNALLLNAKTDEERAAATEATPRRKLHEARLALNFERTNTKAQILEKYFNIAYFGNGVYGVATAAEFYFSKPVKQLKLHEAALLAGLVKNPGGYDPIRHPKAAKARRDLVLSRMAAVYPCPVTNPHINQCYSQTAPAAAKRKLGLKIRRRPRGLDSDAPYFLDYVQDYLLKGSKLLGKTEAERHRNYFRGGLTIRTSIDPKMQRAAQRALETSDFKDKQPHSAIVVIEPGTGAIKAMAVNVTAKKSLGINLAIGGDKGKLGGMQAGSTFKVFVLAAAIEQGIPLGTTICTPKATYVSKIYKDGNKPYDIKNAGDSRGAGGCNNLLTGTWKSVNVFYLPLAERTGIQRPVELARAMMGRRPAKPDAVSKRWQSIYQASFIFGASQTSVLDVANAYATIAARGMACSANSILEIKNSRNKRVKIPGPECYRAISEKTADTLAHVLQGVIRQGTATRAQFGRPAAGKTGSSNDNKSAFFAGFTPQYAAAVWVGNSRKPTSLKNFRGPMGYTPTVYGGTVPAIIWRKTMSAIHQGLPVRRFPKAPSDIYRGETVSVPFVAGLSIAGAKDKLADAGLSGAVAFERVKSHYPAGRVAGTTPAAGSRTGIGSTVIILVSNGIPPPPPPDPIPTPPESSPPPPPDPRPGPKPTKKP
jgi:membrane peptidoglycan carboxypeptidase